jgi:hypothetical protein
MALNMKKILTITICFFLISTFLVSAEFKEILWFDLETISDSIIKSTTEIMLPSKRSLGKYLTADMKDIIQSQLKDIKAENAGNLIISLQSETGETLLFTYLESLPSVLRLPPFIVFANIKINLGDTVVVNEKNKATAEIDLTKLKEEYSGIVQRRVFIQVPDIHPKEAEHEFPRYTIVFPQDYTKKRWLRNIRIIKVFMLK